MVWTEGGRFGRNDLSYRLADHFSASNTVLIWDRRNAAGQSDIALSEDPWFTMTDSRDLRALLRHLDLGPAHLMGGSAGCTASLLLARDSPQLVASLILLHPPTDDPALAVPFAEAWVSLGDVAIQRGMDGVLQASRMSLERERQGEGADTLTWIAESIELNPSNKALLLGMDPTRFAATVSRWGGYIRSMRFPFGMSDADLQALDIPALIVPGRDDVHPRNVAERLAALLPRASILDYPDGMAEETPVVDGICSLFPEIGRFLRS